MNNTPVTTNDELYIQKSLFDTFTFDDIISQIAEHFGEDSRLNEFDIAIERYQTDGCGCHPNDSDYSNYLCITRRPATPYGVDTTLQSLLVNE